MNLWIKTQSGDLIKPKNIKIGSVIYPYIWVFTRLEGDSVCLGEYKTEERAKEVLCEIEKLLNEDLLLLKNTDFDKELADYVKPAKPIALKDLHNPSPSIEFIHRDCIVYEMPKE